MNISRKWSAAAAGVLALALVGGGTMSASAAEGDILNPQSNGSKGSFHLWDENFEVVTGDPTRVFERGEYFSGSSSATDFLGELNPSATRPVTGAEPFTAVWKFLSDRNPAAVAGGTNTWKAWATDSAAGPNGGTLMPELTLDSLTQGIDAVIAQGGEYYYGIAYTKFSGVATVGAVYREITIEKGTGNYTVGPIEFEGAPAVEPVVEGDLTAGLELTDTGAGEGVTTTTDSTIVQINAGVANANKTLNVGAFSTYTDLGQVTLDADGKGSVDVAGKGFVSGDSHKLFLSESDGTVVAWGSFALTFTVITTDNTVVSVEVTTSNRFELVAPAAPSVDLGDVKRDKTTTPVALGQFSVIDDRDDLKGWNLNISATAFTGPNSATIANTALGYTAAAAGGVQDGVTLGAAKIAGEGVFGKLAEGAAAKSTTEDGAHFNADLTFKAPIDAVKGAYNSTLTLDLVSK